MNYAEAKAMQSALQAELVIASAELKTINGVGSGVFGITPDNVRARADYQAAKRRYNTALNVLRNYNATYLKQFAREIRADRAARTPSASTKATN